MTEVIALLCKTVENQNDNNAKKEKRKQRMTSNHTTQIPFK